MISLNSEVSLARQGQPHTYTHTMFSYIGPNRNDILEFRGVTSWNSYFWWSFHKQHDMMLINERLQPESCTVDYTQVVATTILLNSVLFEITLEVYNFNANRLKYHSIIICNIVLYLSSRDFTLGSIVSSSPLSFISCNVRSTQNFLPVATHAIQPWLCPHPLGVLHSHTVVGM